MHLLLGHPCNVSLTPKLSWVSDEDVKATAAPDQPGEETVTPTTTKGKASIQKLWGEGKVQVLLLVGSLASLLGDPS